MPSKNSVKVYTENGHYHIYNRGVEKRDIFLDEQDCRVFLRYLKLYLCNKEELEILCESQFKLRRFIPLNLSQEVDLLCFALMPNHIHLFVKQYTKDGIVKFTRRLFTSYVMYFNKKYNRVGTLFQSKYKAVNVTDEAHFLHLSRYIHLNSQNSVIPDYFKKFSSYSYYLMQKKASWIKPDEVLTYFKSSLSESATDIFSYQNFVESHLGDSSEILGNELLEDNS